MESMKTVLTEVALCAELDEEQSYRLNLAMLAYAKGSLTSTARLAYVASLWARLIKDGTLDPWPILEDSMEGWSNEPQ